MPKPQNLTFAQFQAINAARADAAFPECADWTAGDWGNALAGETGELCNLLKKQRRGQSVSKAKIAAEIADVITYACLISSKQGIPVASALRRKFNVVSRRKKSDILL